MHQVFICMYNPSNHYWIDHLDVQYEPSEFL